MPSKSPACIAMCMPVREMIEPDTVNAVFGLVQSTDARGERLIRHQIDPRGMAIAKARNEATRSALSLPGVTHLLWVDSDMSFRADAAERLVDDDRPIVGGLCFMRYAPYPPVMMREFDPSWGFAKGTLGWLYDYPRDAIVDVDATGAAFLLVRREVFEKIRETHGNGDPEWAEWWTPMPPVESAEDFSFCFRAREAGFGIAVDTGVKIVHHGKVPIDEAFALRNRQITLFEHQPSLFLPFRREELDERERPKAPVATVIIPTYQTPPKMLHAAVLSALRQTVPVEIIVLNGNMGPLEPLPTLDGSRSTVRVVPMPDTTLWGKLNAAVDLATTDWLCWLSADDIFLPNKVEAQLLALKTSGRMCGFHGWHAAVDNGLRLGHGPHFGSWSFEDQRRELSQWCAINGLTTMIHRSVFEAVGRYDESFELAADWELWCRIGARYHWHYLTDPLAVRREWSGNGTAVIHGDRTLNAQLLAENARIRAAYSPPDFRALLAEVRAAGQCSPGLNARVEAALAWPRPAAQDAGSAGISPAVKETR